VVRRGAICWLVCLFQALAIISAFQLSSIGHFASDVVQMLTEGHHHHDSADGDEDQPGHECPPGCPNCHHVHPGGASVPPASDALLAVLSPPAASRAPRLAVEHAPAGPSLPSVFRPPRA